MNTCAFLAKAAKYHGDEPAIRWGDELHCYRDFYDRALAIGGNLLAWGLKPGDRVAFALANSPRILEVIFGCFAAGLVVVPINARLHAKEMAYIVGNSGARVLVHGPEYDDGIRQNADQFANLDLRVCTDATDGALPFDALLDRTNVLATHVDAVPEDLAWLFYTSGTTGKPKGAVWNHRTIRTVVMNYLADVHNISSGEAVLHAAPLSHGSGIVAMPAIARGAQNIILHTSNFDPQEMFRLIETHKVGHIAFLAPTQIVKATEEFIPGSFELSSLRSICYGGAPIYVEHLRKAHTVFGPVFSQIYGQGEAPITITGLRPEEHVRFIETGDPRIGSAGTIRTDVEMRIVDGDDNEVATGEMGEVVARGDVVMLGYWNNPEATGETLAGGWLHTGDIGKVDENGYLYLLDRAKDVIISGGNNIYPREIEEVLVTHPAINTAVVFGVPDDYWGEAVHAVVVPEPGGSVTTEEVIAFCLENLASYKKPKSVEFMTELPLSGYGKVQRREMREAHWTGYSSKVVGGKAAGSR